MRNTIDSGYKQLKDNNALSASSNNSRFGSSVLLLNSQENATRKRLVSESIVAYKKMALKTYISPNTQVISLLKNDLTRVNIDDYTVKEFTVISKLFAKYFYFKQLQIAPGDPSSKNIH